MELPVTKSEDQIQAECFKWHWNNMPQERGLLFHGVSDLIYLRGPTFIEMKSESGGQSSEQRKFQIVVESLGYKYVICRSLEQFKNIILNLQ